MRLWLELRDRRLEGFKFLRQFPVEPYVVDFICREKKLVVEVDGGQHAGDAKDRVRDNVLMKEGYKVLRFWNHDVLTNTEGVLETILAALRDETPEPSPGPPLRSGHPLPAKAGRGMTISILPPSDRQT